MKEITAHIFDEETLIVRNDSSEVIICNERVYRVVEIKEIIKYFWGLDSGEYDLTTVYYAVDKVYDEEVVKND